jgi:hypothetical protein
MFRGQGCLVQNYYVFQTKYQLTIVYMQLEKVNNALIDTYLSSGG